MPFSHHSHSGQFCPGHAKDQLEDIVQTAITRKLQVFALTEHMPRHDADRYPEETGSRSILDTGFENQAAYYAEAVRLREIYGHQIQLPIGFEVDFCRPQSAKLVQRVLDDHQYDFFIGSLHHVKAIPIDYDKIFYMRAREQAGGRDEQLFADYFDEQLEMLEKLRAPVVGHFDLIRLFSEAPDQSFKPYSTVWPRILRNLKFVCSYGGLLEINCASLRKGMSEPYPKVEIAKEFLAMGGRLCLSDDSHAIEHVALNYQAVMPYLEKISAQSLHYLEYQSDNTNVTDDRFPHLAIEEIKIDELKKHPFWN